MKTIKPRVSALTSPRKTVVADSWRSGKSSAERGYDGQWRKARECYLSKNPLCAYCQRSGRLERASVVDHIIPHKGDRNLFWDSSNWQSLCARCHNSTKQKEEYEPPEPYSPVRR